MRNAHPSSGLEDRDIEAPLRMMDLTATASDGNEDNGASCLVDGRVEVMRLSHSVAIRDNEPYR